MELLWIGVAFLFGMLVKRLGQPPLLADLGVLLMLFTVGLKLKPKVLLSAETATWRSYTARLSACLAMSSSAIRLFDTKQ